MRHRILPMPVLLLLGLMGCAHDVDTRSGMGGSAGCEGQTVNRSPYGPASTSAVGRYDIHLSAAQPARVQVYRVRANRYRVQACGNVALVYEVVLARQGEVLLREVREYYADDGTLITSNSEDVSGQLRASGRYTRSTTLPIPAAAPVGRYRVVSKLLAKKRGDSRFVQLGRAATSFYVE